MRCRRLRCDAAIASGPNVGVGCNHGADRAGYCGVCAMTRKHPDYNTYIHSKAWKRIAHAARVRAGFKCQLCGAADRVLDVHHNTYVRLGHEPAADLVVLCRECHDAHHLRQRNPRLWKAFVAMARLF